MTHSCFNFDHSYATLLDCFYHDVTPTSPSNPSLICVNHALAKYLGVALSDLEPDIMTHYLSGHTCPPSSHPLAMAYAGHQFGHFVPQLGDGRAILLGEHLTPRNKRVDIQLKGCGRTRFSRGGDGLAPLGAVLREYIVSEAMFHLGIPTTRALAAVATGDTVYRETPVPGGVITRVASSHIRVGTFEYFYYRQDLPNLKRLLDYTLHRHDPTLPCDQDGYLEFFKRVSQRLLSLVAHWMGVGFIHGVMNTDNTAISGETIDFGPCAFMDTFRFDKVFSSIDRHGRYAYDQQAKIAIWNMSRLAICLTPFIHADEQTAVTLLQSELEKLEPYYQRQWRLVMGKKCGIFRPKRSDDRLITDYLQVLQDNACDFTIAFRALPTQLDDDQPVFKAIAQRLNAQPQSRNDAIALMMTHNPDRIPRNHQIERVIQDAYTGNLEPFHQMLDAIQDPFKTCDAFSEFCDPPSDNEVVTQTFCGT